MGEVLSGDGRGSFVGPCPLAKRALPGGYAGGGRWRIRPRPLVIGLLKGCYSLAKGL